MKRLTIYSYTDRYPTGLSPPLMNYVLNFSQMPLDTGTLCPLSEQPRDHRCGVIPGRDKGIIEVCMAVKRRAWKETPTLKSYVELIEGRTNVPM